MKTPIDPVAAVTSEEPVPPHLTGTTAGTIFGKFARMNDGDYHGRAKGAITRALGAVDLAQLRSDALHRAVTLADVCDLSRFGFEYPVHVVGHLLGVPDAMLSSLTEWSGAFVRCIAPTASGEEVTAGIIAADRLRELFAGLLTEDCPPPFLTTIMTAFEDTGAGDPDAVIANVIGFLFQTHDATAGLIGNSIVHVSRHPGALDPTLPLEPQVWSIVSHAAHHDAPIQNTRRYMASDDVFAGHSVRTGDAILVVLATATGDEVEGSLPFGYGRHACPGRLIALTIAEAAIAGLFQRGLIPVALPSPVPYRSLANARIPILGCPVSRPARENAQ